MRREHPEAIGPSVSLSQGVTMVTMKACRDQNEQVYSEPTGIHT